MFQQRRRERGVSLGVMLLLHELLRNPAVPPITLSAVLLQVGIFLDFIPQLSSRLTQSLCLLPSRIVSRREWIRLFAPLLMHADDMHLYYNMISFMWKGRRLEPLLGRVRYLLTLIALSIASSLLTVAISIALDETEFGGGYARQCAVGFSGVIFALKVLCNEYTPEDTWLMGLPIPSKYACWAELFLIQMVTPNASFVGHLAGIVAGLLYVWGPLRWIVDSVAVIVDPILGFGEENMQGFARRRTQPSAPPFEGEGQSWGEQRWNRPGQRAYQEYTGGLSEEEQIRRAMEESQRDGAARRRYGWNID